MYIKSSVYYAKSQMEEGKMQQRLEMFQQMYFPVPYFWHSDIWIWQPCHGFPLSFPSFIFLDKVLDAESEEGH